MGRPSLPLSLVLRPNEAQVLYGLSQEEFRETKSQVRGEFIQRETHHTECEPLLSVSAVALIYF